MNKAKAMSHGIATSAPFQIVARLGLVVYGVVHLLVAWLALQVAFGDLDGGGVGKADKTGALQSLSAHTSGDVVLWLIAAGLGVSALWQLLTAVTGDWSGRQERLLRLMNIGETILFAYLSFIAGKLATGSPASSTDSTQLGLIGSLLSKPWGKPVVVVIGLAIIAAGLLIAHQGIVKRFVREHDFRKASPATHRTVVKLGKVGYTALGAVYGFAGALVVVAALQSQPAKATGLDVALKTLAAQPYGVMLLSLVAVGLTAFATFTLFSARYRHAGVER